ncbi:putative PurR-regulated permease PerM [Altererythrobacter atlanticus]|uniref:Uncharacterized protein n=1 Tax=Croceibacterium atlanticum TaxID=1267766 RepID=A0A0F7KQ54_9SPHN|nr:hypothetical protein [Croceibacterium atlanticum]AKH41261.1 hypothetical protein WYH_00196 [Croceibacterium atlanticum]MBB5732779.1 putative PurR-regulated permease PerM [Croceibacterium atlanticum]
MQFIRQPFLRHYRMFALLVAIALFVKLLVPMGYMIVPLAGGGITLQICAGQTFGALQAEPAAMAHAGHGGHDAHSAHAVKADTHGNHAIGSQEDGGHGNDHCAFSAIGLSSMASGDPFLLALALAFILALGFAPLIAPVLQRRRYSLPPLRGPPHAA